MSEKHTANRGDIFSIPLDSNRVGTGQIISKSKAGMFYGVFFDYVSTNVPSLNEIISSKIVLAGNFPDAKLWHGHWKVIGNYKGNLNSIPLPNYKVMQGGAMYVESFDGLRRRRITEEEAELLLFRSYIAPVQYEKALAAHHQLAAWDPDDDKLLYENILRSKMIGV